MKRLTVLIIIGVSIMAGGSAFAWHRDKPPVTPYGDFCSLCGEYGSCKKMITSYEAEKAMQNYYFKKGLSVEVDVPRGRFIRAKIIKTGDIVDVIIFDRLTGRIRSIY